MLTSSPTGKTGVLEIGAEEYFSIPALSHSGMKDLAVSPLRYWHLWVNPERPTREETSAMRIGSALHCAVLEPAEKFESRYACALDPTDWPVCLDTVTELREWLNSKGVKPIGTSKAPMVEQALSVMKQLGEYVPILAHEEKKFFAENQGKTILKPEEWRRVSGMARVLLNEPVLQKILSQGKAEVALTATDPETGVLLKCRVDWLSDSAMLDPKTFTVKDGDSVDRAISKAIFYQRYHIQAALYKKIHKLVFGKPAGFINAFVESEEPHEVRILRHAGNTTLYGMAEAEINYLIRLYAHCWKTYGDKPWRTAQETTDLDDKDFPQTSWTNA